jgi:UDP-N-acetylmuramyl pentapeptide phosphotransferase/UDP-N-acetylglucosamine-1-phosphate transferase
MIIALAAFVLAAVGAAAGWRATRSMFAAPVFARTNYRDHPLPTSVGVLIALVGVLFLAIGALLFEPLSHWGVAVDPLRVDVPAMAGVVLGFGLLGLLDDIAGVGESGGFRGHLRALAEGRLTTGSIKLFGGAAVALAVVLGLSRDFGHVEIVIDAAIVCLAANLANLLDRAPGRTIKAGLVALGVIAVCARDVRVATLACPVGAAAGLLPGDLREEFMLGDAGSNALGAACGLGAVIVTPDAGRWVLLAVLVLLNLLSEVVSFSSAIDQVAPLRWLDRAGSPFRH